MMVKKDGWRLLVVGVCALGLGLVFGCEREEDRNAYDMNGDRAQKDTRDVAVVVELTDTEFKPKDVTVKVGDTVMWKNTSRMTMSVIWDPVKFPEKYKDEWKDNKAPEGFLPFKSGDLKPGDTWKHQFTVAGTFYYWCGHKEDMTGTVTVKPKE